MADYEIKLGVQLDTSDIVNQINAAERKVDPIKIKVDAETKELTSTIKEALRSLSSGTKSALTLDTTKIEASFKEVSIVIKDIRDSLGTLDNKSGMKSLLSSINQISSALEKASNQFEGLNKNLNALSGKDLSFNLDFKLGGSNSVARNAAYGNKVRSETLPELQKQVKAFEDYFREYYKGIHRLSAKNSSPLSGLLTGSGVWEKNNIDMFSLYNQMADGSNLAKQMGAYRQYISVIKEAASLKGIDISPVTSQFSQSADQLVQDAVDVQTGAKEMEESFEKLKQVFGSGNNLNIDGISAQLDSIVTDLGEIKTTIQSLSSSAPVDGLTQSFNRLSDTLDKLVANLTLAKDTLNTGFSNGASVSNAVNAAQQTGQKIGDTISKSAKQSLNIDDVIDKQVTDLMEKYAIAGKKGSKAFEEIRQAIVSYRKELALADNTNVDADNVFSSSSSIRKATSSLTSHIKVANDAKETYKDLLDFIKQVNASGAKVHLPDTIKQEYGDDFASMRSRLGKAFTTGNGQDFESFVVELNSLLGNTIDLSQGAEAAFGDLVNKVGLAKGNKFLSEDELFRNGILSMDELENDITSAVNAISAEENKLAQSSTETANTVAKNAKQMADAYDQISSKKISDVSQSDVGFENIENDLKQVTVTADNTTDAIQSMRNAMSSMKFNTSSIDAATKDLEEMNVTIKEVTAKQGKNFDITVKGINEAKEAVTVIKRFNDESGNFDVVSTKISKPFDDGTEAAKRFKKEAETAKNIKFDIEVGNFDNEMDEMIAKYNRLSDANDDLRRSYDATKDAYKEMLSAANTNTGDEVADRERLIQAEKEYAAALEKTNNLIKKQARIDKVNADAQKLEDDSKLFQSNIDSWLTKNSAAAEKFGDKMLELRAKAENCDRVELNHLTNQFKRLDKEAEKAGLKMQSFGDRIKTKLKEYSAYFSVAEVFMYITQGLRDMFDQVVAIDSAMTELKKVTNETGSSYDQFLSNAASRAKELGITIDGLVGSAADFARLGYEFKDVQGLAEVANIYSVVGDDIDSVETATQSLISTMTAFKDEMNGLGDSDFALSIVDKFNEVSNNFAISSGGIGEALQRSASSMAAANNSLDETIALITAA